MSTIEAFGQHKPARFPSASFILSIAAAGLFLGSAALQVVASLQRWVMFRGSRGSGELSVEDHLFDYAFPTGTWENIGTTAQLFGAGTLMQALGILAMVFGVLALPRAAGRRSVVAVVAKIVLAVLVAAWCGLTGAHALLSGVTGVPSPLQHLWALDMVGFAGLVALGVLLGRRSWAAMAACVFLIGSTWVGYFVAAYLMAPTLAGYTSHDTTPWTETIVAASTVVAGIAMLFFAWATARR